MKKTAIFVLLAFLGCCQMMARHDNKDIAKRPKLVVGIVIDQMRWDYLYRYQHRYGKGGFRRMLGEGFSCETTMLPYVPSVTAIGHTCIGTHHSSPDSRTSTQRMHRPADFRGIRASHKVYLNTFAKQSKILREGLRGVLGKCATFATVCRKQRVKGRCTLPSLAVERQDSSLPSE